MSASTRWKIGTAVILAIVCGVVVAGWESPPRPVPAFSVVDVPRMAFRGELIGRRIRVILRFDLRFAADRRSAIYSPSPGGESTKTVEFLFRDPVHGSPGIVEGTVREFRIDTGERLNRLPGYAVISDCVAD